VSGFICDIICKLFGVVTVSFGSDNIIVFVAILCLQIVAGVQRDVKDPLHLQMPTAHYNAEDQKSAIDYAIKTYNVNINLWNVWAARSPTALRAWIEMDQYIAKHTKTFTPGELQIIQLTVSSFNRCYYCMAFHTTMAIGAGVSERDAREIRDGGLPAEAHPRLRHIVLTVKLVMQKRANLTPKDRELIRNRWGITDAQLYDITVNIGLLTAANYLNLLEMPPIDEMFAAHKAPEM